MIIPLGSSDWQSIDENTGRIRLHNMYLIENPFSPDNMSRVSRPTLTSFQEVTNTPVYGIWSQEGTLDGSWLVVMGETLYKFTLPSTIVSLGPIPGTDYCQFAGTATRVIITRNGIAYSTDGTTISTVNMPDDVLVGSVACINSSFLLSVLDSQRFYWIDPGETDPDPLNFASAERTPDSIVSINIVSDEIWILGQSSVEVWTATGDLDAPYQRISGRVYTEGCVSLATAVTGSYNGYPSLLWVTEKMAVIMAQGSPSKISDESVEELLRNSETFRAWTFRLNRHDFYVLTCDEQTVVYDITAKKWCRWDTYLKPNWRAHLGLQVGPDVYAGDIDQGIIWKLEEGLSDDGVAVIREVSGFVGSSSNQQQVNSVHVRGSVGRPPEYASDQVLELRWSDDGGLTWSKYYSSTVGQKGEYSYDITYRSLGLLKRPGREFEFRFSGPARFRIDYATINEV